jgi:hypothetical protein
MFIPDPHLLSIPDLGSRIQKTATKERGGKNLLSFLLFVATNIKKLKIILFLNW